MTQCSGEAAPCPEVLTGQGLEGQDGDVVGDGQVLVDVCGEAVDLALDIGPAVAPHHALAIPRLPGGAAALL